MEINMNLFKNLQKFGIYKIRSKVNNKVYIGSTLINFNNRFKQHLYNLLNNKHPNKHLQNSFNKYGIDSFEFSIVEIIKDEKIILDRERYWIEFYDSCNRERGYNINPDPNKSPALVLEVKKKIADIINNMYDSGKLSKHNIGSFKKGSTPWNKGKTYKSTDHLKVPKNKKGDRTKAIEIIRSKLPIIQVYNLNNLLLFEGITIEIEKESNRNNNVFISHMSIRNINGRNGYSPYVLKSSNIMKSTKTNKPYKGLIFKLKSV